MNRREMILRMAAGGGLLMLGGYPRPGYAAPRSLANPLVGLGSHGLEDADLRTLRQLGVVYVRHTLYWHLWENDREYRRHTRNRIDEAIDRGFRLLIVVHAEDPSWGGWPRRYELYDRYAKFMGRRAREMPGVEAWEIFNEGEGHMTALFGAGRDNRDLVADGADCARLHRQTYRAIKDSDPNAIVVAMSFSTDDHGFKKGFYEGGYRADVLNYHMYGWPMDDLIRREGRQVHAILAKYGQEDREVWCTEFGISRDMIPLVRRVGGWENAQSDGWEDFVTGNDAQNWFSRIYGYQLQTDEAGRYGPRETHGLVRPDYSLRPAAQWLRSRLRSGGQ